MDLTALDTAKENSSELEDNYKKLSTMKHREKRLK